MKNKNKKAVLAFSGGLDTTFCAKWLQLEKDMEVYAITINTGGFSDEEIQEIEQHAYKLGVKSFKATDVSKSYYDKVIKFLLFGNVLKNGTYPLSVSAERIVQAIAVAEYAALMGADAVVHGSTGAGNDQVRFDMIFNILIPEIEIITPIRDLQLSREAEIEWLKEQGVKMNFEKAAYSINKGIWGTSVGGKETLGSHLPLPEEAWPIKATEKEKCAVCISFHEGEPVKLNGKSFEHPTQLINALQQIAAPYGIGRDIHTGDTIIGIKGRVGFEAAAPLMLIKAHHTLEKHVLGKWQLYWKDQLSSWYGNWMHEGQYLDPVMRNIEALLTDTQKNVSGEVYLSLYPFRFTVDGIKSENDLMSSAFGSYGEMNKSWTGEDVKGFTKIFGNQTAIWHKVNKAQAEELFFSDKHS